MQRTGNGGRSGADLSRKEFSRLGVDHGQTGVLVNRDKRKIQSRAR